MLAAFLRRAGQRGCGKIPLLVTLLSVLFRSQWTSHAQQRCCDAWHERALHRVSSLPQGFSSCGLARWTLSSPQTPTPFKQVGEQHNSQVDRAASQLLTFYQGNPSPCESGSLGQ